MKFFPLMLVILALLLGSTACQALGKAPASPPSNSTEGRATSPSGQDQPSSSVEVELGFAGDCTRSGGKFDSVQNLCDCAPGKSFSGWMKKCVPIQLDSEAMSFTYMGYPQVTSNLWGRIDQQEGFGFAEILRSSYQLGSLPSGLNFTVLAGSVQPDTKLGRALRSMLSEGGFFLLPREGFRSLDWVYTTQKTSNPLAPFKTPVNSMLQALPPLPAGYLEKLPELAKLLIAVNQKVGTPFVPEYQNNRVEGGCERYCELSQEFHSDSVEITRTRVIVGGSLLKDWIRVWEDSTHTSARALAVFSPSGEFSHFYHFSKPSVETGDSTSTYRFLSIYGSDLKPLVSNYPLPQPMTANFSQSLKKTWTSFDQAPAEPQVIVCESGFDETFFLKVPSSHILHGPLQSSLYGWVKDPSEPYVGQGTLTYSGVASRNEFGVPETLGDLSSHAQSVVYNLVNSEGKIPYIIPIGIRECLNLGPLWIPTVLKSSQARVVSLSSTDNYDRTNCNHSPIQRSIESADGKLLWVVAAGNDGLNLDRDFNDACPATLKRDDVLSVASGFSSNSPLDYFSNFGTDTVDLAAEGASELDPSHRATSYAAPRVASVAAELIQKFPSLTPRQLKRILLLSVELNPQRPLEVRSGGFLSRDRAHRLAAFWVKSPSTSAKNALLGAFGSGADTHRAIQIWFQRGLLGGPLGGPLE